MKGKISPNGIVATKSGPTVTCNDPAKFHGPGKTSGKIAVNGVEQGPHGTTFTENSTHISTPNADKAPPKTKVESEKCASTFMLGKNAEDLTASAEGAGGPTDRPYALKERYGKGGRR